MELIQEVVVRMLTAFAVGLAMGTAYYWFKQWRKRADQNRFMRRYLEAKRKYDGDR